MIRSMTGYGRGSSSGFGITASVELRSVNHRYADFVLRIPRELYSLEDRIRRLLQERIGRGRIEAAVTLEQTTPVSREICVNQEMAASYYSAMRQLSEKLSLPLDIGIGHLLQLPEVVKLAGGLFDEERSWANLEEALREALDHLVRQREREGESLLADLLERHRKVGEYLGKISELAPAAREEHRLRMESRLKEILLECFDENRVLMECAILVERMAINEELVRLASHLRAFEEALAATRPVGRKLDFIAQEMLREINTIGSKAADSRLAGLVVEIKSELEKMREQIQNIE